jgi:hypothetical protein
MWYKSDISSSSVSNTFRESARMLENLPVPCVPDIPQNIGSQSDCSFPGAQINILQIWKNYHSWSKVLA